MTMIEGHQSHPLPSSVHQVKRPRHCTQAHNADRPIPNARAPPPTDDLNGARLQQQSEGNTSTHHNHRPLGPKALALRTRMRHRSPNTQPHMLPPPMAMTPRCHHHTCHWDTPPAPPTHPVNQAQGPWHRAQMHNINCLPPPCHHPPTATMPCHYHHNGPLSPTMANRSRWHMQHPMEWWDDRDVQRLHNATMLKDMVHNDVTMVQQHNGDNDSTR